VSRRIRVAVLAGGRSSEHEISLASARSVLEALDPERYEAVTVAIGRDGRWRLDQTLGRGQVFHVAEEPKQLNPVETRNMKDRTPHRSAETLPIPTESVPATLANVDVVLPILHGPFGEDGTVQGLLELADVPYVGAGVAASALCMDKDLFKKVMRDSGVPVAEHVALRLGDEIQNPFGYPVFVKPARLGSSVGITKVHDESELGPAVELARQHDEKVLVEEYVAGMEVECGVLGNRVPPPIASLPGRIDTLDHEWYDFASKYDEDGMELIIPPELAQETIEHVQQLSVDSFVASECEGMARVDFFVRDGGEVVVNELNTIPGFTATSVYAKLFEASGIPYSELLDRLVDLAVERHERRSRLKY
jgi:D-alanine-D-alanine ligase